ASRPRPTSARAARRLRSTESRSILQRRAEQYSSPASHLLQREDGVDRYVAVIDVESQSRVRFIKNANQSEAALAFGHRRFLHLLQVDMFRIAGLDERELAAKRIDVVRFRFVFHADIDFVHPF